MKLLAIDGSASLCAACVLDGEGRELGRAVLDLGKGHAEHLIGVIEDALRESSVRYADLGRIAVSIGPGSFTGVRVAVSTARGLALALKIPARGITTLEAIAAQSRAVASRGCVMAVLDAGRDEFHLALYDDAGGVLEGPVATTLVHAVELARTHRPVLCGTAAAVVKEACSSLALESGSEAATADIAVYGRLALRPMALRDPPKPIYLRRPKPQAGFAVARSA